MALKKKVYIWPIIVYVFLRFRDSWISGFREGWKDWQDWQNQKDNQEDKKDQKERKDREDPEDWEEGSAFADQFPSGTLTQNSSVS